MTAWRPSIRSQLVWSAAGLVLLTVLLFAAAAYRLVVVPAEDEIAANSMQLASTKAVERVQALVANVETLVRTGRDWGAAGLIVIDEPERFGGVILPMISGRAEKTSGYRAADA